jgi:GNAT superfamily N-acetyltransferase
MVHLMEARTSEDFQRVHDLVAHLAEWDARMTGAMGLPTEGIVEAFYSEAPHEMMQLFTGNDACMLLAWSDDGPLGCAGFVRQTEDACELEKVYVSESARGRGLGKLILDRLLDVAFERGYKQAYLETAVFMTDALRLYEWRGFTRCDPFRDVSHGVSNISVFLRCALPQTHSLK